MPLDHWVAQQTAAIAAASSATAASSSSASTEIKDNLSTTASVDPVSSLKAQVAAEVSWGLRCLLEALSFLNGTCGVTHGCLGPHAVFVCRAGDWKLAALDCAGTMSSPTDRMLMRARLRQELAMDYAAVCVAPERRTFARADEGSEPEPEWVGRQGAADVYSLGQVSNS